MKSFGITDKGAVRTMNQDCFIIEKCDEPESIIFAVCDGMGGEKAGDLASRLADKAFVQYVFERISSKYRRNIGHRELLIRACQEANGVAWEYSRFDDAYNGMGTTIVGGVADSSGKCSLVNVGDSRAYIIPNRHGHMTQITRDHSLVADLVQAGIITSEQAKTHPQRNVITRALGSEADVSADYFEIELRTGDTLLLCSDGLYNTLSAADIQSVVREYDEPEDICTKLMSMSLNAGARDNVTVLVIRK